MKSDSTSPPTPRTMFCSFNTVLAVLGLLPLYITFRIRLSKCISPFRWIIQASPSLHFGCLKNQYKAYLLSHWNSVHPNGCKIWFCSLILVFFYSISFSKSCYLYTINIKMNNIVNPILIMSILLHLPPSDGDPLVNKLGC